MNTNTNENVTKREVYYDIVNGPNKSRIFDVCKYACDRAVKLFADFTVAIGYTQPKGTPGCAYIPMKVSDIRVHGIEHEDGSGESLNLTGYCKANLTVFGGDDEISLKIYRFKAYYDCRSRKGCISFIE